MKGVEISDFLKPLMLTDLRMQCRARKVNPAGSREALQERLRDHMLATNDFTIVREGEAWQPAEVAKENVMEPAYDAPAPKTYDTYDAPPQHYPANLPGAEYDPEGAYGNNYGRPEGQNVGNFLTDRPSSRVLAPLGGDTQVLFGTDPDPEPVHKYTAKAAQQPLAEPDVFGGARVAEGYNNNYHRPSGQNVGNFLTDRNSSRVLAPPGGASQVLFG